jgi:hypothetical protein
MAYVSYCGLLCNECPVYVATAQDDTLAKAKLAKEYSSSTNQFTVQDMNCYGCFSESSRSSKMCGSCEIRNCAELKGVENCDYCTDYPCRYINAHVPAESENRKRLDRVKASG